MKQTTSGTTVYVYDAGGSLAAEYMTAQAANPCGTPTCYVSVDQIGSTRLVTDSAGNVARRYDYLPFGEEVPAGTGGRTTAMGYQSQPDGLNPKFTGQYRDTESFLDYFHARYYSPAQGRFVSPDPGNAGADAANPQTWNGYAYVGNNPLIITDPNGEGWLSWLGIGLGIAGAFFGNPEIGFLVTGTPAAISATAATVLSTAGLAAMTTDPLTNGQPPGFDLFGGTGGGSLYGCNGPLGGCGADTGPWSEDSPAVHNTQINPLAVFDLEDQNGRTVLPDGDVAIYGFLGFGGPILSAAGKRANHDMGCVGLGGIVTGGPVAASAEIIPKRFSAGGTSGTSVASKVLSGGKIGTRVLTPVGTPGVNLAWKYSANLGRIAGRYLPYIGTAAGAATTIVCLGRNP